ncbi:MAG: CHAT domain-containing protein [Symploca sp. SIO2D2]|nr:CHAT domain-containing protein [Symploca sp. SIO2D2]
MKIRTIYNIFILFILFIIFPTDIKAEQNDNSSNEEIISQNIHPTYSSSTKKIAEASKILELGYQSYSTNQFSETEKSLKQVIKILNEGYSQPPNFEIPRPARTEESSFSIPYIFNYYSYSSKPSEFLPGLTTTGLSLDNLFSAIATRISRSKSDFTVTDLRFAILNHFQRRNEQNTLQDFLFKLSPQYSFPEIDEIRQGTGKQLSSSNDIYSLSKKTLNLLQKTLIAQDQKEKLEEALEYAELSRNLESVRIAPIAIYGLLNSQEIASNPAYSRFYNSVPFKNLDIKKIKKIASKEDATLVYYSTVSSRIEKKLFIWVVQPSGNIFFKKVDLSQISTSLKKLVEDTLIATSSFIDRGEQETALIEAVRNLRSPGYESQRQSIYDFRVEKSTQVKKLQALYQLLIKPVEEYLPSNEESHVVFVPQDSLTTVPFAALQDSEGRYLIEKHTIRMAHSISNLANSRDVIREIPQENDFIIVGNPIMPDINIGDSYKGALPNLPQAELEVRNLAKYFNGRGYILNAASERNVAQLMSNAKIIHLATHGILNFGSTKDFLIVQKLTGKKNSSLTIEPKEDNIDGHYNFFYRLWYEQKDADSRWQIVRARLKLPGAIALSGSYLTAEEILSLPLQANLVVLSACNTGRGVVTESSVLGLPFAFGLAGVPKVVVSLWSVPDTSTRILMNNFYHAMDTNIVKKGYADPAKSLREAMLKVKARESFRDPIHWAGFTVINVSQ